MSSETGRQDYGAYRTYTDHILNKKGKKIFCYYWEPKETPRALLLICHGFTDHSMLYETLAKEMAEKGFFVFANDLVGHGRSEGTRALVNNMNSLVDDVTNHILKIKAIHPNCPLFLWGHSMGGAIAFLTSLQKKVRIDGLIAVAPALAPNPETATPIRVALAKFFSLVFPGFPVVYADVSLSCRDKTKLKEMNADPLRFHGYFKARSAACLLKSGKEILKNKESVDVPYLLLHGDEDKVCSIVGSRELHNSASSKDKTFIIYSGAYHSLFQEPEDVSSDVLKKSVEWLTERA